MRTLAAASALAAAALLAAGCGTGGISKGKADTAHGKQLFQEKCGSCHTLADAGTNGTQGPNLDALMPPLSVVQHQVEVGGGIMPAFKGTLTAKQIAAVARYVSRAAGKK